VKRFTNRLKLKYFRNNKNIGATANILKVIDRATAKYCWIIGDDDLLVHGAIEDVIKILKSNPDEAGIVVGYSYEKIDRRPEVEKSYSCDFSRPIFQDITTNQRISCWEETFKYTKTPALHTSIVSCIFNTEKWRNVRQEFNIISAGTAQTDLNSTFPYSMIWGRMFSGKPIYFISRPLVYFFVGAQEWFDEKWNTIMFSFCLELARFFRKCGAKEDCVRYYENLILESATTLKKLIVSPNSYSRKHFSLLRIVLCYWNRLVIWKTMYGVGKSILRNALY
jgi:glycosyltransferase involved in cell wall biosynthesis